MCGVAGVFHYGEPGRPVDVRLLTGMTRALRHRGPDGEGLHVDGAVGLGHRRLAIVDPTMTGAQPMATADGSCWLSYNGEFYNHRAFRGQLAAKGVYFRGTSDTETLAAGLQAWGPKFLAEVAGIFGLAFWDSGRRRLLLARDPLGVKQIYYHDDGRRIVFASEMKALLHDATVSRQVDGEAINQYLHFHTPLFERTFFRAIRQVRAGEYLEVDAGGIQAKRYWSVEGFAPDEGTPEEQVAVLRNTLEDVVGEQLMADVPLGAFFSGGIDSSAVVAFAARNGIRPRCYGVHFSGQGVVDERPFQEEAGAAMGVDLELITLDGSSFADDLMRLTYFQDQPVIGAAMFPMYHVSRLAASGVKVCLGGQGADELFGGYARYALVAPARFAATLIPRSGVWGRGGGVGQGGARVGGNLLKQVFDRKNVRRAFRSVGTSVNWRRRYFKNFCKVSPRDWTRVFGRNGVFAPEHAWNEFCGTVERSPARGAFEKVLHWDVQTYLPGLFQQDDRMSMANGLESRVPIADPRLVRLAFRTPSDLKLRDGASKWILRQAVAGSIPSAVLNRRKVGFDTPAERWMRGTHAGFVRELLTSARARSRGYWDGHGVERAVEDVRHPFWFDVVWKLTMIEAWARVFVDELRPGASA